MTFKVKTGIKVNSVDVVNSTGHWVGSTIGNDKTTASSANGASTIVLRDANGDFTSRVITATTFSGSGASLTNIPNSATTAASANGASTIVARDANGSFVANVVTATQFSGGGSGITAINADNISSGTLSADRLATSGVTANTYGSAAIVPQIVVDSKGRITIAANVAIAIAAGAVSGLAASATTDTTNASNITAGTLSNARTTAASANGASTIVARDANGSFAANVITATQFSGGGAGITSINADNITSGTLANARTTAASANGASTIVARDANGSFAANVVTATQFSGGGAGITSINADNISAGTIANARTTGSSANGASTLVLRDANGDFTSRVITATTFSGSGSLLTTLNASNLSSGTIANARTTGSSANGASTLVLRDANGDFTSRVITATTFSGSGASLTNIPNSATTAASANGANSIVARDANGSFAANVITATQFSGGGAGITALNADNIASGTIANARTTGSSANGASTLVLRDANGGFSAGNITVVNATVSGNLTVSGVLTAINSNEVNIGDSIILLNSDETGTPSQNGGIEIERGTSQNVSLLWNETSDRWTFTNDGTTYRNIPIPSEYDLYSVSATTAGSGANVTITAATSGLTSNVNIVGSGTVSVTRTDASTITIAGAGSLESTTANITNTAAVIVDSFSIGTYRTAEYTYHIKTTTGSAAYATGKILLVHDDSSVYLTQYGMVSTNVNDDLATFTSNISSNNVRLLAQGTNSNVTVKLVGTAYSTV